MQITDLTIKQIKARAFMSEVAPFYGCDIKNGFMCCPFHGEDTPSLKIYKNDRGWHCFGCGEGNDVIDFTKKLFGITFFEACIKLNKDFCLGLPVGEQPSAEYEKKCKEFRAKQAEKKKKREQIQEKYWQEYDKFLNIEKFVSFHKPQKGEIPCANYFKALKELDFQRYLVEELDKCLKQT